MNDTSSTLHLRPHHLLCLQTFVGRGYSDEFVSRMTLVKRQLTEDPDTPIVLVIGADDLCAHCPNCVEGKCTSEKPALFDRLVAEKLIHMQDAGNLDRPADHTTQMQLAGIPEELHISPDLIEQCCPDCQWKELCISVCRSY